jgi:hypothetical protein
MEDKCAITYEPEESPTVRYRLLIGLMRVLVDAEVDHNGSAEASPSPGSRILAARREPRPDKTLALPDQIQIAEFVPEITLLDCFIIGPVNHVVRRERRQQIEMACFRFMQPGEQTVHDL